MMSHGDKRAAAISRRDLLLGLGVMTAGAWPLGRVLAQASGPVTRRVDVHHHFFAPIAAAQKYFRNAPSPEAILQYTPARSLDALDGAGIDKAMLSSPVPFGDDRVRNRGAVRALAREINEYGAKLVSDHKARFGLFAVLPLPDIEASLREIEYVFDTLKADGVGLVTSYGNRWLGDAAFEPVFDELNRRKAVVYTHPVDPPCCRNLQPDTAPVTVEWLTDTSRAIWSLINDGIAPGAPVTRTFTSRATRYADTQFIWSHAGGTLLGLVSRFLGAEMADLAGTPQEGSKLHHLRRFYYDTATVANPLQLQALRTLVGSKQIVFGTDFPFVPLAVTMGGLNQSGLSGDELKGLYFDNVLRILPGAA